ncbi:MAG TPA: GDP-mannose 4,6-dehydratase [bacterium]|nr:GDP-mannose 4,6-dehydratase [bacterium]
MRVLIVGATGFVGRHLVRECASRGDDVWGTFRPDETPPEGDDVRWLPLDLLDDESVTAGLEEAAPEGVVHLAGQANVAESNRDPVGTFRVNAEGTYRVLSGIRRIAPEAAAVAVTSAEVYGAVSSEDMPVAESSPLRPRTPYGVSKAAADLAAAQAAAGWGLRVIRARPFNHIGPGQRRGFVGPDFASQVAEIEAGTGSPELRVGNLSGRRDFTDVRDVARGYRDALERGVAGRAYNLCSGRSVPIGEILQFFVDRARVPIRIVEDPERLRPVDIPEFRGDPSRAKADLGWSPRIPLEQSLQEVLDEWRSRAAAAPH